MLEQQISIREGNSLINYLHQGEGKVNLLFLHGWCINSSYWKNQIHYFSNNYSVYALDLAGFGKSTSKRNNWSIEEYAKDVKGFIQTLGLKNVFLVGHSMSGLIMLQTVLNDPTNIIGIAGVENFQFVDVTFPPEQIEAMMAEFDLIKEDFRKNAPLYADKLLFQPSTSEAVRAQVKADFANADPEIGYMSIMDYLQTSQLTPTKLENAPFKLNLLNSEAIPTNVDGLENHCKNSFEVLSVGHTGHYPMIENPDVFNEVLEGLLKGNLDIT